MAGVAVPVGRGVNVIVGKAGVTGVDVKVGIGVPVGEGDAEAVGEGVNVKVKVEEGIGEAGGNVGKGTPTAVGVMNAGLPYSLQPRSGAAPRNPVMGLGRTGSPFGATYCGTPLSIAGELGWSSRPLKSSSTVPHAPSG